MAASHFVVNIPGGRGVELPGSGTRKSEIQLAGRFSKANSSRWAVQRLEDSSANSYIDIITKMVIYHIDL